MPELMNKDLIIREYAIDDKPRLIEILKLNVPSYFAASEIEDYDRYLNNEIEQYFVIEFKGGLVGAGGINFNNDCTVGIISWDVIHPNFQGRGFGSKLLNYRIALLKSLKSMKLIAVRTSQFAYKFYEHNGFVLKEIQKDYWAKGFDMYQMIYEQNQESPDS